MSTLETIKLYFDVIFTVIACVSIKILYDKYFK